MPETRIDYILNAAQAQAEAAKTSASFEGVSKAAQSAGVAGAAGFTRVETATRVAAVSGANLQTVYEGVVKAQGASSAAAQQIAAAMGTVAPATTVAATASTALAASTEAVAVGATKGGEGLFRLTSMINTGQGPLRGYDALIQALVRSIGGIPVWAAVAIPIVLALAQALFKKGEASAEAIKIDKEQLATSLALADAQQRLIRVQGDLFSAVVGISREAKVYLEHQKDLVSSQQLAASGTGVFTAENAKLAISLQRNQGFVETAQFELGALAGMIRDASRGQQGLNKDVVSSAEALSEQDKKIRPLILAITEYRDQTGQSSEAVIEWAAKVGHLAPEAVEFLREQLQKIEPFIVKMTEDLQKLTIPKFDMKNTAEGIEALTQAVLSGLTAGFDKGLGGSATTTNSFRATVQALSGTIEALDQALKRVAGNEAAYNRLLSEQLPSIRSAIELHKQLNKEYNESFKTKEKTIKDITPQLEMESLKASIALNKENFEQKRELIKREFDLRREEMVKNRQDTELNMTLLQAIEIKRLHELDNEYVAHYQKIKDERLKDFNRFLDYLDKTTDALRKQMAHQRQIREDEEKKFFENQAKIEFAARSNRAGRKETQADEFARQADEMRRVHLVFNDLNRDSIAFQAHLKAIDAFSRDEGFLSGFKNALGGVINEFDLAQAAGQSFATALQSAFDRAINYGENFAEVFGKVLLAGILSAIGQQAIAEGTYHILAGIAKLFNPFTAAQGAQEIAAGAALVAFGSALVAGASAITNSMNHKAAGGTGGAATTSGASSSAQPNPAHPPTITPFPTSPSSPAIVFDGRQTADLVIRVLESRGMVSVRTLSNDTARTQVGKSIKKLARN